MKSESLGKKLYNFWLQLWVRGLLIYFIKKSVWGQHFAFIKLYGIYIPAYKYIYFHRLLKRLCAQFVCAIQETQTKVQVMLKVHTNFDIQYYAHIYMSYVCDHLIHLQSFMQIIKALRCECRGLMHSSGANSSECACVCVCVAVNAKQRHHKSFFDRQWQSRQKWVWRWTWQSRTIMKRRLCPSTHTHIQVKDKPSQICC